MYYFGTNLDNKFNVEGFWPKPEQTHKIPTEREEIIKELDRLKRRRLALRDQRLAEEGVDGPENGDIASGSSRNAAIGTRSSGGRPEASSILKEVQQRQEGWRD